MNEKEFTDWSREFNNCMQNHKDWNKRFSKIVQLKYHPEKSQELVFRDDTSICFLKQSEVCLRVHNYTYMYMH